MLRRFRSNVLIKQCVLAGEVAPIPAFITGTFKVIYFVTPF
jgi:hypothetical protein